MKKIMKVRLWLISIVIALYCLRSNGMETVKSDVRAIVTGLYDISDIFPLFLLDRNNDYSKDAIIDRIAVIKESLNNISSTIDVLGTDCHNCSKMYKFFRKIVWHWDLGLLNNLRLFVNPLIGQVEHHSERFLPHKKYLVKNLASISNDVEQEPSRRLFPFKRYLMEILESISNDFERFKGDLANRKVDDDTLNSSYANIFLNVAYLFSLFNGRLQVYKDSPNIKQEEERAKKYKERIRKVGELYKEKIITAKEKLKPLDEIAGKPDLSGLALMFLDPPMAFKKGIPIIEENAWLRNFLKRCGVKDIEDVEQAMEKGMAPSTLIEKAHKKVPAPLKPPLIFLLRHCGRMIINPTVWLCNKLCGSTIKMVEGYVDEVIEESEKPSVEDQLFPYLLELGNYYQSIVPKDKITHLPDDVTMDKTIDQTDNQLQEDVLLQKYEEMSFSALVDQEVEAKNALAAISKKEQEEEEQLPTRSMQLKYKLRCAKETGNNAIIERLRSDYRKRFEPLLNLRKADNQERVKINIINKVLRNHPLRYLSQFLEEHAYLSDETNAYLQELVMQNQGEFKLLLKKYFQNPTIKLSRRSLFNTWLEDIIQRESKQFFSVLSGNREFLERLQMVLLNKKQLLETEVSHRSRFFSIIVSIVKIFGISWDKDKQDDIINCQEIVDQGSCSIEEQCQKRPNRYFIELDKSLRWWHVYQRNSKEYQAFCILLNKVRCQSENFQRELLDIETCKVPGEKEQQEEATYYTEPANYNVERKDLSVSQQQGADCGYHALYNAFNSLKLLGDGVTESNFVDMCKKRVAVYRDTSTNKRNNNGIDGIWMLPKHFINEQYEKVYQGSSEWLSEDEVLGLMQSCPEKERCKITVILDIQKYIDGSNGLDVDVINQIAETQQAMRDSGDYERVYIIATGQEKDSWEQGHFNYKDAKCCHWIAVKQSMTNGSITHQVMNSLPSCNCENLLNKFEHLMCNMLFTPISKEQSKRYEALIKVIEYSKAFRDQTYALSSHATQCDSHGVIINETPQNLIDRILEASFTLLEETKHIGVPFYCIMGYVDPLKIVWQALNDIRSCDGKNILVKVCSNQNDGSLQMVDLTCWQPILGTLEATLEEHAQHKGYHRPVILDDSTPPLLY